MRTSLNWDVLFVLEDDELRRAPDVKHFRLAQQLHRGRADIAHQFLAVLGRRIKGAMMQDHRIARAEN